RVEVTRDERWQWPVVVLLHKVRHLERFALSYCLVERIAFSWTGHRHLNAVPEVNRRVALIVSKILTGSQVRRKYINRANGVVDPREQDVTGEKLLVTVLRARHEERTVQQTDRMLLDRVSAQNELLVGALKEGASLRIDEVGSIEELVRKATGLCQWLEL